MKLYGEQGHKQEKSGTGEPEKQGILGKKPTKKVIRVNRGAKFGSVCHQSAYHSA